MGALQGREPPLRRHVLGRRPRTHFATLRARQALGSAVAGRGGGRWAGGPVAVAGPAAYLTNLTSVCDESHSAPFPWRHPLKSPACKSSMDTPTMTRCRPGPGAGRGSTRGVRHGVRAQGRKHFCRAWRVQLCHATPRHPAPHRAHRAAGGREGRCRRRTLLSQLST